MRQTSEQFMEEMLKDNQHVENKESGMSAGFEEKIANMIDQRIDAALSQFRTEAEKVNVPDQEQTQEEKFQEVIDSVDAGKKVPEEAAEE